MHSRAVRIKKLGLLTIRPLRCGDTETVAALFDRADTESQARRFDGAEPRLSDAELTQLATVDSRRHTLVAHVDGDPQPAGIAQLVRDPHRWTHAEIVVAVAEGYHGLRIGSTLVELLAADARAAGITQLTGTGDGPPYSSKSPRNVRPSWAPPPSRFRRRAASALPQRARNRRRGTRCR